MVVNNIGNAVINLMCSNNKLPRKWAVINETEKSEFNELCCNLLEIFHTVTAIAKRPVTAVAKRVEGN